MNAARNRAQRLLVFRYVKTWMEEQGECPTALQVSRETDIPHQHVLRHMRALRGATGLPCKIPPGSARRHAVLRGVTGRPNTNADLMVPVDTAMRLSSRGGLRGALATGWDGE
jgi:hypothetical protein